MANDAHNARVVLDFEIVCSVMHRTVYLPSLKVKNGFRRDQGTMRWPYWWSYGRERLGSARLAWRAEHVIVMFSRRTAP